MESTSNPATGRHAAKPQRRQERIVKGFANHRRIEMLGLLQRSPELSLQDICLRLRVDVKVASAHLRKLVIAGLILKRHDGRWVRHKVTDRGQVVLRFLATLE